MGTIRSEFTIEQFEAAFQRFAHQLPKFHVVRTENANLEFIYDMEGRIKKIHVYYCKRDKPDSWGESLSFSIEPKEYVDSPHITKIHYDGYVDKNYNEKILRWLDSLMGSEKPTPRFSLAKRAKKSDRKLTDYKAFAKT